MRDAEQKSPKGRLREALTMAAVFSLSIILLLYVAYGESERTYEQFQIEKIAGQGESIQDAMQSYLRAGLPVRQFVGFASFADALLSSDSSIARISTIDNSGQAIFEAGAPREHVTSAVSNSQDTSGYQVRRWSDQIQVVLPLNDRFERVASLGITANLSQFNTRINEVFLPLGMVGGVCSLCFGIFVYIFWHRFHDGRRKWMGATFTVAYLAVAALVMSSLVGLYSEGVQAKAKATASALAGRLDDVLIFNLSYKEFDGLDSTLADYQRLNPDVRTLTIVEDGTILIHTNKNEIGKLWLPHPDSYEISLRLSPANYPIKADLIVDIPRSVIYGQIARNVKNFAALFLASGLFAVLFLELARALQTRATEQKFNPDEGILPSTTTASLVKPAYFLAVFAENLTYAFLPQYVHGITKDYGLPDQYASAPFIVFYLCFALALLPAGHHQKRWGARSMIGSGLVFSAASYSALAFFPSFPLVIAARALAGLAQGILFIGVQTYTLSNSNSTNRTEAAGIIVFGYQAGMLSGMAIGSLLISRIDINGVLELALIVALFASCYTLLVLPQNELGTSPERFEEKRGFFREVWAVISDFQFLRSILLIGIPAKAVMTGIILFALPLLLAKAGVEAEDIGQIAMVYAASVIIANYFVKRVDYNGGIESLLSWGSLIGGVGLCLVGTNGISTLFPLDIAPILTTLMTLMGVCLVGLAHGCINAPVITYVTNAAVSKRIGATSVAATYRFLERIGHMAGPLLMGQLFQRFGLDWNALYWTTGGVFVCTLIFIAGGTPKASANFEVEQAQ